MEKILGLDLGTNSIGWAIREINEELDNQIIDKGVLTFDKGVAEDKSGEHPMVQKRTEARGKRRNYQAEKYRKWELLKCLIEYNMCPLTIEELNEWKHYKKDVGRKYPQRKEFIDWLRFDFDGDGKPDFHLLGLDKHDSYYAFRAFIIEESKRDVYQNNPHIIGRVFYQLVQRRGYNDGDAIDETEKEELSKTIMKGGGDSGAIGVNEIEPYLKKYKTLGASLYYLQKETGNRIRKRYNLRSHFKQEIEAICKSQNLQEDFLQKTLSAITWQRPLRTQKGLVGICTFEQNKRRCPISHPLYEEYRTWVFINNLKIKPIYENDIPKNKIDLKEALSSLVYPLFYKASPDFKLSTIKKELAKNGFFVSANFPDDTKVLSLYFLNKMKEIFGEEWSMLLHWSDIQKTDFKKEKQTYTIEDLWHLHFTKTGNKKTGESATDFLNRFAIEKLKLDETKAEQFSKIRIQQGYATLSLNAIKKIIPYLRKGFIYSEAVYMANLPKVMGRKLQEGDIDNYAEIIRNVIRKERYEQKKNGVLNNLIAKYFESPKTFEENKITLIEEMILEVFGKNSWNRYSIEKQNIIETDIFNEINSFLQSPKKKPEEHYKKTVRLHDQIFKTLMDDYSLPAENIKHLWHPSEQDTYAIAQEKNGKYFLGSPEPISKGFKNPMALKTMHYMKKLINYLIEVNKIDADTRIVVEVARELNDTNKRKAIERWQRDREKENDNYKKQIEEINKECKTNFDPNDKNLIDKIRLWEEQKRFCLYTGNAIGLCDVLDGTKYDFEHTIPASMSFDNELKNLTIADKTYNQQIKGKKLPSECPNYDSDYIINNITYSPILSNLELIFGKSKEETKKIKGKEVTIRKFQKIEDLEKLLSEWISKTSDDKTIKDNIVIRRHLIKMELDYWRYKLQTFTTKEYKAGWRNSQLRDTQTITKYAIPYLKTVFHKVEVQKGSITADFRKIYRIQSRKDKKERIKHSHHAIDAAVLTLIPASAIRDQILLRYNQANEIKQNYHENPRYWKTYHPNHILNIENEVLNNYKTENRTLVNTYKTVRKRGKIQFVKEKTSSGTWQYKLDESGNKIPLTAKGDTIRGQLHKESFFGAIQNKGELNLVERYPIASFTSINDCKHIVDDKVRSIVKDEIEKRLNSGMSFDKAKLEPFFFPNTNQIIKKVRCKVLAGAGYLRYEKAEQIREHTFTNEKHKYKNFVYAQNNEMTYLLFYENEIDKVLYRAFNIVGLFSLSHLHLISTNQILEENNLKSIQIKKGKNIITLNNPILIKTGTKCIFYKENIHELKELALADYQLFLQRVFIVYKFNTETNTHFVYLKNQIEARADKDIKEKEFRIFDPSIYQSRLQFTADKFNCAIENRDFIVKLDGSIEWLF